MLGMVGRIGVMQTGRVLNGCWANCVASTFDLIHDLDYFMVKF